MTYTIFLKFWFFFVICSALNVKEYCIRIGLGLRLIWYPALSFIILSVFLLFWTMEFPIFTISKRTHYIYSPFKILIKLIAYIPFYHFWLIITHHIVATCFSVFFFLWRKSKTITNCEGNLRIRMPRFTKNCWHVQRYRET